MDQVRAQHYLELARELKPALEGPKGEQASEQLEAHEKELRAALNWFIDNDKTDQALILASSLWRFWIDKGHVEEGGN